jgi:ABC-type nitrate/sulfonate/bicarbonate transport system permease component
VSATGQRLAAAASSVAVAGAGLALWAAVTQAGWVSPVFLPGPAATWQSLVEGWRGGDLALLTWGTVERMAYGWALACAAGLVLGGLVGSSALLRAWLQPSLELLRPLPASALVPVAIALIGLSPGMVLLVIAFGAMWPVLLATAQGYASIETRLHEVGRLLGLSRVAFFFKVGLPHALPDALAGMRLSLTIALILAIVGEMLASQPGLGLAILQAARSFRSADLFAGVALLGAVGLFSNGLLSLAEHRLLRWQHA